MQEADSIYYFLKNNAKNKKFDKVCFRQEVTKEVKLTALTTLIDGHTPNIYKSVMMFFWQKKKDVSHNLFKLWITYILFTIINRVSRKWSKVKKYGN